MEEMDSGAERDHSLDLPLLSNTDSIHVRHYVLDLTLNWKKKALSGSVVLFCEPVEKDPSQSEAGGIDESKVPGTSSLTHDLKTLQRNRPKRYCENLSKRPCTGKVDDATKHNFIFKCGHRVDQGDDQLSDQRDRVDQGDYQLSDQRESIQNQKNIREHSYISSKDCFNRSTKVASIHNDLNENGINTGISVETDNDEVNDRRKNRPKKLKLMAYKDKPKQLKFMPIKGDHNYFNLVCPECLEKTSSFNMPCSSLVSNKGASQKGLTVNAENTEQNSCNCVCPDCIHCEKIPENIVLCSLCGRFSYCMCQKGQDIKQEDCSGIVKTEDNIRSESSWIYSDGEWYEITVNSYQDNLVNFNLPEDGELLRPSDIKVETQQDYEVVSHSEIKVEPQEEDELLSHTEIKLEPQQDNELLSHLEIKVERPPCDEMCCHSEVEDSLDGDSFPAVFTVNSAFEMVLDSWKLNVTKVYELCLLENVSDLEGDGDTQGTQHHFKNHEAQQTYQRIKRAKKKPLAFQSETHCVRIRKPGVTDKKYFPRIIQICYQTPADGPSLKWTNDQHGSPCVYTHGHWINNRSLFPSQDAPTAMATWQAFIHAPVDLKVLMSGDDNEVMIVPSLISVIGHSDKKRNRRSDYCTYFYQANNIMPSSTLALAIGHWIHLEHEAEDTNSNLSSSVLPWRLFVPRSMIDVIQKVLVPYIPRCLQAASEVLGTHPFTRQDFLIVPGSFSSLGMASPNLIFLSQSVLSEDGGMLVRVAHEVSHAWFGLSIGPRDWHEEWLSEGFATFTEGLIHGRALQMPADQRQEEREVQDYLKYQTLRAELQTVDKDLQLLRNHQKDDLEPGKYVKNGMNPDKSFMQLHYLKGYFLLRHLETECGTSLFLDILRSYVDTYKNQLVESKTFLALYKEKYTSYCESIDKIMDTWLDSPGLDMIKVPDLSENSSARLVDEQVKIVLDCNLEYRRLHKISCDKTYLKNKLIPSKKFSSTQVVLLLEKLLELETEKLNVSCLQALNHIFNFSGSNADVLHRWCELVVRYNVKGLKDVQQLLTHHQIENHRYSTNVRSPSFLFSQSGDYSIRKNPARKRKRICSTPTGKTPTQTQKKLQNKSFDSLIDGQRSKWSIDEKKFLQQFVATSSPEDSESDNSFWARCAKTVNLRFPDSMRTGASCRNAYKRLSIDPCLELNGKKSSPQATGNMETQTEMSLINRQRCEHSQTEGEWIFWEPKKDLKDDPSETAKAINDVAVQHLRQSELKDDPRKNQEHCFRGNTQ